MTNKEYYNWFISLNNIAKDRNANECSIIANIGEDDLYCLLSTKSDEKTDIVDLLDSVSMSKIYLKNPEMLRNWDFRKHFSNDENAKVLKNKGIKYDKDTLFKGVKIIEERKYKVRIGLNKRGEPINSIVTSCEIGILNNSNPVIIINIIMEDKGSAIKILKNIILLCVNQVNNIRVNFFSASGIGSIPRLLDYCKINNLNNIIVLYDRIGGKYSVETEIVRNKCQLYRGMHNINIAEISPYCIEELCITFGGLLNDTLILTPDIEELFKPFRNRLNNAVSDYFLYDILTDSYYLNGKKVEMNYASEYIKKYKNICTVEQYISDKLAQITYNMPYEFVKSASSCWYVDCPESADGKYCISCRKTYIGKNKILEIVNDSLFSLFYDIVIYMIEGILGCKTNKNLYEKYIIYNKR